MNFFFFNVFVGAPWGPRKYISIFIKLIPIRKSNERDRREKDRERERERERLRERESRIFFFFFIEDGRPP